METKNVKRLGWFAATLASMSLAFAGIAAADSTANPGSAEHQARRAEILAKYDTNKDGKLEPAERAAMRADMKAKMLAKYDTNGDGKLEPAERAVVRADFAAKRFAKMDTNGDGVVTLAEMQAFAASHPGHRHGRRFHGDHVRPEQGGTQVGPTPTDNANE